MSAADEFEQTLRAEVRKAKVQALEEAADAWHAENTGTSPRAYQWLRRRAREINEEEVND